MLWNRYPERSWPSFWRELGLNEKAALTAAQCFPEYWWTWYKNMSYSAYDRLKRDERAEEEALATARKASIECRTDARHPAFWLTQGCDFDEAIKKAVAAVAMVRLQREATPPPPPQRDNFAEVAQALLLQGSVQRRLEEPGGHGDQCYDASSPQEPFDPNDYPRFRAGGS